MEQPAMFVAIPFDMLFASFFVEQKCHSVNQETLANMFVMQFWHGKGLSLAAVLHAHHFCVGSPLVAEN